MTTSGFDPEISNANLNAAQYYIDDDGALKFVSPYISSSNFDGTIPVVETTINAENIEPGMLLQVDAGEYLPVISVSYDDVDLESSPSSTITIGYVDSNNELNTIDYNFTDSVDVRYEDWANKDLGNQGWSITSGGNAIFANVGVRGDLEATTLDVGGTSGITYDGSTVTIGASVIVNAPITFNGVTEATLSASLAGYIPDGGALGDIISTYTVISGGLIRTGVIESTGFTSPGNIKDGSNYSTAGMAINLDNGAITAKNWRVDTGGSASFKGNLFAAGGFFGQPPYQIDISNNSSTNTVGFNAGTLKIGSQVVSPGGPLHGVLKFHTTSDTLIGTMSSTESFKDWSYLGQGIVTGTTQDYIFIPSTANTTNTRIILKGNGIDFRNASDQFRVRINSDGINLSSDSIIKFLDTSGNEGAHIDYAPASDTLIIDNGGQGGGVVNIRASALQLNGNNIGTGGGTSGVSSFEGRTGAVTLQNSDITGLPQTPTTTGAKVLYARITSTVPSNVSSYPDNSIVIIT